MREAMEDSRYVPRTIHFIKVACEPLDFNLLLEYVNNLPEVHMYSATSDDGGGVYLKSLQVLGDMQMGIIGRLRMNGLPSVGTSGLRDVERLNLSAEQGLVELTHFIYFRRSGILAVEYNHTGPRASTLERHLRNKYNEFNSELLSLSFQQIFDEETFRKLSSGSEVRQVQMVVPRERIGNLAQFDKSIYAAFENAAHFGKTGSVELVLRFEKSKKGQHQGGDEVIEKLQGLVGIPDDTFDKFRVRVKPAIDEKVEAVDLLQNRLAVIVQVILKPRDREIDAATIFGLIKEAYVQQRRALERLAMYEALN